MNRTDRTNSRRTQWIFPNAPPIIKKMDAIVINEVQLLLAEKRTSLATMRTGIAVFVLPLSVTSFLIVTSKNYDFSQVSHMLIPLLAFNALLTVLGGYLVVRALKKLRRFDRAINEIKRKYSEIAEFLG